MPYEIMKNDSGCPSSKPFGVRKKGGGKLHGCHPSRPAARKQQAALYAAEEKGQEMETSDEKAAEPDPEMVEEKETKMYDGSVAEAPHDYVPWGVMTFAELRAAREADDVANDVATMAEDLRGLMGNRINQIMSDEAITDKKSAFINAAKELAAEMAGEVESEADAQSKEGDEPEIIDDEATLFARFKEWLTKAPMKTVDGKKYPASDFLVVGDPQSPSTWHLQVKRNGTPNRGLAGAAWAALFSPGGHRGNKYSGPGKSAAGKKLRALYKAQGWELPGNSKETSGLMIWKEADGTYHWLARYSNNFRDQDNPPEIISEKSHRRFVEMVDKGQAALPDLWLWHRPEWKWGKADWIAYDDSGFALAAGTVAKGAEAVAEHLMTLDPALVRVSHGMPKDSIVRDEADDSVIVEHLTREISPLPAWAAANQRTGFILLKEAKAMAIPQDKRDALQEEWDLSNELLAQLEAANAADAKEAEEAGIESKEVSETEPEAVATEEVAAEPAPEADAEPALTPHPDAGLTRDEVRAALESVGQAIVAINEQLKELRGELAEAKTPPEPPPTLSEMFTRAIGSPEARVDGRTTEAKDRPQETKAEKDAVVNSGHPLADTIINSIVDGSWMDGIKQ